MPENAIDHLRAIRRAAEAGVPLPSPAAAWFVTVMSRYEAEAACGTSLDRAAGLSGLGGGGPWWTEEARRLRNDALRRLRRDCYAGLPPAEAAKQIGRLADRRRRATTPPVGRHEALIDAALRTGVKFPKARHLTAILCNSDGD